MQKIQVEELVENKVLPYSIYDAKGEKVFSAGDILTPGKLLQIKQLGDIFKNENEKPTSNSSTENTSELTPSISADENFNINSIDDNASFSMDDIDISTFNGTLNKLCKIDPDLQLKFKAFHSYILTSLDTKKATDVAQMYFHLRDRIISDIVLQIDHISLYSELRIMGDYKKSHALNVAILSGVLAYTMGIRETALADIVLGSLVHDIGKTKIPPTILEQTSLTDKEIKIIQTHTKIGYKILKEEFMFPENISKIALEHHESSNGAGYPYGKSGDFIDIESRIISVCNYFDNLVANQTNVKIHNCHEALKVIIEKGSKMFAAEALYTFVHMFSYNDTISLEEMSI